MALVFPVVMLMQMVSAGAMGGGISSAVARALGAGRRAEADALVLHAIVVNVALGAFFSVVMLVFGPAISACWVGQTANYKPRSATPTSSSPAMFYSGS
jgi:Na+-driven multidrug efflux pump